ncbi:winged helix-turn-helix domain-containing protein [Desulfonatronum thioautotrophicum]|uniref:winged helix-turn-helix domain-containing protein n=1 Tax=Desulfonatronum thioautotrophicum TaxID=617001 RepID=UPI0005EB5EFE|nr:LysR family transcriptional regulator [Desulfonatronum thioautotrophicum]
MKQHRPTVRLHIWLEEDDKTVFFGSGRAMLLDMIQKHGSIKKASQAMGMSYRAAWGKIKASEKALGVQLVEFPGHKRDGCRLTPFGVLLRDCFLRWFAAVEQSALDHAATVFPWPVKSYAEMLSSQNDHPSTESPASPQKTV